MKLILSYRTDEDLSNVLVFVIAILGRTNILKKHKKMDHTLFIPQDMRKKVIKTIRNFVKKSNRTIQINTNDPNDKIYSSHILN
jgi:hypothetical protein